jgi:LmbE family N-acetylglucosaminyl deacetylase
MNKPPLLQSVFRHLYRTILQYTSIPLSEPELRKSAIIFSPHPDDETLGCGGTILLKKRAGAEVKIVFLTDGTASHKHLIPKDRLKEIRIQEALSASRRLGVDESDVIFLAFDDGKLGENQESAQVQVEEILSSYCPEEVFIPYSLEQPLDHAATNHITLTAIQHSQSIPVVNEYPIWFWNHWPWASQIEDQQHMLTKIRKSLRNDAGRLITDFRSSVTIVEVLENKQAALEMHRSQMTRLISDPSWQVLADVSQGEFLACFFQKMELFKRYRFPGK